MSATQALHAAAPHIAVEACYRSGKSLRPPILTFPCKPLRAWALASPSLAIRKAAAPLRLLVARTSDWAQQEEDESGVNAVGEEQPGLSDWEGEVVLAEGESEGGEFQEGGVAVEDEGLTDGEEEGGYPVPPEEAKLFVGNLPYDMDSESLAKLFDQAGIVEICEVIYNRATDQSRGFGFVTMSTVEEAEKAIEMFHRYDYNGRFLTVNKAAPRGSRPERPPREAGTSFGMYVGNLPWQVDDARLVQVFSEHGKVVDARVIYDRETGRSRGFGFVTMSTQTEVDDAIAALDGQDLDGRAIRVNIAEDRPRRNDL